MKTRAASCPSCGGTVEFRASSSLVTICPYCRCVVARGDKAVEDHGKVADLVLTDSPLELGVTGRFIKRNFEVVGRVQYKHPAGGVWDEWYLSFSDGTWGWLAEAQGKHYLTFERKMKETASLPEMASIEVGRRLTLGKRGVFTVAEVGIAETGAAEGEIPWDFVPGRPHRFVDLHGDDQAFATLDYNGASPRLFLGKEISLNALDLSGVGWSGLDYAAIGGGRPSAWRHWSSTVHTAEGHWNCMPPMKRSVLAVLIACRCWIVARGSWNIFKPSTPGASSR
ncbi:MAG: DUF4178 domain-containing protein [Planctomycetaceae bacterium]